MLVFSCSCFGPRQGARQTFKPARVSKFALSAPFAFVGAFGYGFILRLCHHPCTRVKCLHSHKAGNGKIMAGIDDTIAALETKLKQAKAKKQQLEAQKRAIESKKNRANDTRRKILVGAAILAKVDRGEWPKARLLDMMAQTLTRTDDRALFGLDGKAEDSKEEPTPTQAIEPPAQPTL